MDKNMINIDDLIKQRLSGGEEPELPGSWMRMRELLDKEKPEKRIAGFYWRRMLGVMSGLVLLSVLTVGSYKYVSSGRFGNGDEKAIAATNTGTRMSAPSQHHTGQGGIISRADQSEVRNSVKTSESLAARTGEIGSRTAMKTGSKEGQRHGVSAKVVVEDKLPSASGIAAETVTPKNNKVAGKLTNGHTIPVKQASVVAGQVAPKTTSPVAINNNNQITDNQENSKFKTAPVSTNNHTVSGLDQLASNMPAGMTESQVQPLQNLAAAADNTRLTTPAPQQPDRPRDTVNKMTIVQRYKINPLTRISKLTNDTLGMEKITIERPIALAKTTSAGSGSAEAADLKLNAAAANASSSSSSIGMNESMVPLSNYKVAARRTSKWNTHSFDDVVRDVKFNLAQTKFYPGVSAGVNSYLFGPNNIGGFQLGLFGLLTFGDTWGGMVELKYIQRFNNGSTIKDNFYDITGTQGSYMERQVQNFFKFSSTQSIEMPIALRYAAGRLNVLGGINLAYNFAVNAEAIKVFDSTYHPTTSPNFGNTKPSIYYEDFGARFSFGGLLGVSYELTPSIQTDFRISKNFWDNAPGAGAEKVSQQLFRAPSFQLSLFYRFNQRNQIPKAK